MAYQLDLDTTDFENDQDSRRISSNFTLGGDFDIQIDWICKGTLNRHHNTLTFSASDGTNSINCIKYHHSTVYLPHTYRSSPGSVIGTSAYEGQWRITRVSGIGYGYYKDLTTNDQWVEYGNRAVANDVTVSMSSRFVKADGIADPSPTPMTARFDNFLVNSADFVYWQ